MVNNNQQSQIMIIEKHKAKQFIFLDYKFDHRLKRRLATRRNLLPKFLRKMGSDMLPWNYSGLAAHEVCSSISFLISNATLPFMDDFSVTFFFDTFCLSDPPLATKASICSFQECCRTFQLWFLKSWLATRSWAAPLSRCRFFSWCSHGGLVRW